MKIIEKKLEYKVSFENKQELMDITAWCFENDNIIKRVFIFYYTNISSTTNLSIEFDDEENAMAFKLRWM